MKFFIKHLVFESIWPELDEKSKEDCILHAAMFEKNKKALYPGFKVTVSECKPDVEGNGAGLAVGENSSIWGWGNREELLTHLQSAYYQPREVWETLNFDFFRMEFTSVATCMVSVKVCAE